MDLARDEVVECQGALALTERTDVHGRAPPVRLHGRVESCHSVFSFHRSPVDLIGPLSDLSYASTAPPASVGRGRGLDKRSHAPNHGVVTMRSSVWTSPRASHRRFQIRLPAPWVPRCSDGALVRDRGDATVSNTMALFSAARQSVCTRCMMRSRSSRSIWPSALAAATMACINRTPPV